MPHARRQTHAGSVARGADNEQLLSLLDGAAPRTVRRITLAARMMALPRRAAIYRLGQASTGLYVVVAGRVKLSLPVSDSKERVLALLDRGNWFGENALILSRAHAHAASVVENATLAHIPAATFLDCLHQDGRFALTVLTETSKRLLAVMESTTASAFSARERVIQSLLDEIASASALGDRAELLLPGTKSVLASRLHMTAAHLSRMLQDLKQSDLIEVRGRRISVRSVARLKAEYAGIGQARTTTGKAGVESNKLDTRGGHAQKWQAGLFRNGEERS